VKRGSFRYNDPREAKVLKYLLQEEVSLVSSINSASAGHKNDSLTKVVLNLSKKVTTASWLRCVAETMVSDQML